MPADPSLPTACAAPGVPSPTACVTAEPPRPGGSAPSPTACRAPSAPPSPTGVTAAPPPPGRGRPEILAYPAGSLVLLAGLPGAGKSTLLDRLYGLSGDEREPVTAGAVRVIDSRQSRNWWGRYLGPVPPRVRTPLVHATHVWRIARAVLRGHGVVAHTRGTWSHILYGFAWLARRVDSQVHLILLDVDPEAARAGQLSRGRVVTAATFARHCRRWQGIVDRARGGALPPAAGVTLLDRPAADRISAIRFEGARPAPRSGERPADRPGSRDGR